MLTGKIEGADNLTVSFLPSPAKIRASFSGLYTLSNKITFFRSLTSDIQSTLILVKFNFQRILLQEILVMGVNWSYL